MDAGSCSLGETLLLARDELLAGMASLPQAHRIFLASHYPDAHVRREALRSIGVVFADDSSFVNEGFHLTPNKPSDVHVRIGRNVSIAPNVTCICDSCANNGVEINGYRYVAEQLTRRADIIISDEAWVGTGAVLLSGVTVGRCAVVGAGCVLTRDADDYGIYAGVPGKKVGDVRQWGEVADGR